MYGFDEKVVFFVLFDLAVGNDEMGCSKFFQYESTFCVACDLAMTDENGEVVGTVLLICLNTDATSLIPADVALY